MKVKLDFISNSSSTSFVYISDKELDRDAFMKAVGVSEDSPVARIFYEMHSELVSGIRSGETLHSRAEVEAYANTTPLMPDVLDKIYAAIDAGKEVVTASLDSDGPLAESLLCMEIFEIESEEFYINGYDNYW